MNTFAVIKTGGKQYRVSEGQTIKVEKLGDTLKEGETITFDQVLLIDNGSETKVGTPVLAGAKVEGNFKGNGRAKKIIIGKFKAKTRFRRTAGHRQPFSEVTITSIKG